MVIDENSKSLGVMKREAALNAAKEKNLDLIEIAPLAKPPVARIMSYDKFRYLQGKKEKKQRVGHKVQAIKQVQITARAARHDLDVKANLAKKFLAEHHLLNIVLVLRGREKYNRDWAHKRLSEFLVMIGAHRVISPPRFVGRGINIQVVNDKNM